MYLGDKNETQLSLGRVEVLKSGCHGYSDVVDKTEGQMNHLYTYISPFRIGVCW